MLLLAAVGARNRHHYHEWFETDATINTSLAHVKSGWNYFKTAADFYSIVDRPAADARIKENSTVLELGCGVGAALQRLVADRRISKAVYGIDFSPAALVDARAALPEGTFVNGDIADPLPFADNSMDHVVSFGAVGMYLTRDEIARVVKEAVRVVRPGGTVLFTQLVEPRSMHRGSILTPLYRREWPHFTRNAGYHPLVRSHRNTVNSCRYYVTFTANPRAAHAALVSTLGRRQTRCYTWLA